MSNIRNDEPAITSTQEEADSLLADLIAYCREHAVDASEDGEANNLHEQGMWNALRVEFAWRSSDDFEAILATNEEMIREAMYK